MTLTTLATVTRSGLVESTHYGDAVVVTGDGRILSTGGDPQRWAYMRSSGKPLQALPIVMTGAADEFGLTQQELAVCCASHCSSAEHVQTVRGILAKLGMNEDALECGTHAVGDEEERNRLIRENKLPLPIHNNCSGKHAGILASTKAMGVPPEGYSQPDHPVQKLILSTIAAMCDIPAERIRLGVDGCGLPTFAMPLKNMAVGFARLTNPRRVDDDIAAAAGRICSAMAAAPVMIAGKGSFNTRLLEVAGDTITAKGGAEGLFMLGVKGRDIGLAIKASDGDFRAMPPVVLSALKQLDAISDEQLRQLDEFIRPQLKNTLDVVIGEIIAQLQLGIYE